MSKKRETGVCEKQKHHRGKDDVSNGRTEGGPRTDNKRHRNLQLPIISIWLGLERAFELRHVVINLLEEPPLILCRFSHIFPAPSPSLIDKHFSTFNTNHP